jgi:hypothetical protein
MRKIKNACTIFIRKPNKKRPVGITWNWWENDFKLYLKKNRA